MQVKVRNALIFATLSYCVCVALGSRVDSRFALGGVILPWGAGAYALIVSERKEDLAAIAGGSRLMRADNGAAPTAVNVPADTLVADVGAALTGAATGSSASA